MSESKTPRTDREASRIEDDEFVGDYVLASFARLLETELAAAREGYLDLIMSVGNKYPNETRHQTAKRYILRAEENGDNTAKQATAISSDKQVDAT